jgi:2-oxoisovalerate dehydrogenase E1 component
MAETLTKQAQTKKTAKTDYSNDKEKLLGWYRLLSLGRRLDIKAANYLKQAKGWSYHAPYAGHDAIQMALGLAFRPGKDFLFPYYRDMMTCLAGGLTPEEIILNGLSRATDVASGGRHMSNHFAKPAIHIQNVSSCTGNHSQHAVGVARAIKRYHDDAISFYSGGESATSEGFFYEAVNGATREQLPVIFVIQNNGYGISVPVEEQSANTRVSDNFTGFKNLKIINCDGTDVFDSMSAMQEAVEFIKTGAGAVMVHADCVRIGAHSNSDRQDLYRSPEELEEVKKRDPFKKFRDHLLDKKICTEAELQAIDDENTAAILQAAEKAEAAPIPDPATVYQFVTPEPKLPDDSTIDFSAGNTANGEQVTFLHSINETLKEEFRRNPNTFLWGQDVASKNKGGVFNAEKGMLQEFGHERVFNAPIAEDHIVGTANGFCRYREDIWVAIEGAEFADYFWPAMEQLIECSHEYWRTNGQYTPNMLIRLASGGYIQGGLYHSQNLEGTFTTLPGLRVICPSFADDAAGMMRYAMRTRGITLYLEPKFLYNYSGAKSVLPPSNVCIPFGKARVRRQGEDVSIITYGTTVHWSLQAAKILEDQHDIACEVIDLRSLVPLDMQTVIESVKKTGRALVVHEDKITGGFGGEIAARIADECFQYLDAPVMRVGSIDTPVGFAKQLEDATLPNPQKILDAAIRIAGY